MEVEEISADSGTSVQTRPSWLIFFEPELALLVGLQVVSSKEGGRRREGGGGREHFLTSFLVASAKSPSKVVGLGGKVSCINFRL